MVQNNASTESPIEGLFQIRRWMLGKATKISDKYVTPRKPHGEASTLVGIGISQVLMHKDETIRACGEVAVVDCALHASGII
jgi:hypothetical protein